MRIIAKKTLREFWETNIDAREELSEWYQSIEDGTFKLPQEVIQLYPDADIVGNNRIVFNICYNKYRLIALFKYNIQMVFIRFIGTHKEYDKIHDIKNI
jgi:mRNA interferase HigB